MQKSEKKTAKVCKHLQKSAKICKTTAKICESLRKSATCSKMHGNSSEKAAKRRVGKGWPGLAGVGPAECVLAVMHMLRYA